MRWVYTRRWEERAFQTKLSEVDTEDIHCNIGRGDLGKKVKIYYPNAVGMQLKSIRNANPAQMKSKFILNSTLEAQKRERGSNSHEIRVKS